MPKNPLLRFAATVRLQTFFEPGSVFKAFTLSSILENKTFGLDQTFNCEGGSWSVAGKVLHDAHGYGILTFREVIEKSSNIGTVKGAMRLGAEKLYKTIRDFGFGSKTGIGFPVRLADLSPTLNIGRVVQSSTSPSARGLR